MSTNGAIAKKSILVHSLLVTTTNLKSDIRRFHLQVPHMQMICSDFTTIASLQQYECPTLLQRSKVVRISIMQGTKIKIQQPDMWHIGHLYYEVSVNG